METIEASAPMSVEDIKKDEQPKSYQFKYAQMRRTSSLLASKLGIKFWILLSKEEQEVEKEHPTDAEYYRLSYCLYNNFPLLNIVRFFQDKANKVKCKSLATINLKTLRCTQSSATKFIFTSEEEDQICSILGIQISKSSKDKNAV